MSGNTNVQSVRGRNAIGRGSVSASRRFIAARKFLTILVCITLYRVAWIPNQYTT